MSYHGKLQTLKNGTADAEIQLWAYQQLEKDLTLTDKEIMLVSDEFKGIPVTSVEAWNKVILLFAKAVLRKAQEK